MTEELKNRIDKTMQNLKRNNMEPYFVETSEEARELVKKLIRSAPGLTREQVEDIYRQTFSADAYFTSTNALTENGELYNVDGNSNRVAAILYGPKSVVVVCGVNKIVKNIDEAIYRVKTKAAPPNTIRLNIDTYCSKQGQCVSLNKENPELCEGCRSEGRICCNYVVCAQQRHINRIKVVIINEELGY